MQSYKNVEVAATSPLKRQLTPGGDLGDAGLNAVICWTKQPYQTLILLLSQLSTKLQRLCLLEHTLALSYATMLCQACADGLLLLGRCPAETVCCCANS